MAQAMPWVREMGHTVVCVRLVRRDEAGERVLGDYTFAHTPKG